MCQVKVVKREVDVSALLEWQPLSPGPSVVSPASGEHTDVDQYLARLVSNRSQGRTYAPN